MSLIKPSKTLVRALLTDKEKNMNKWENLEGFTYEMGVGKRKSSNKWYVVCKVFNPNGEVVDEKFLDDGGYDSQKKALERCAKECTRMVKVMNQNGIETKVLEVV